MNINLEKRFTKIYHNNSWNGQQSRSGRGSDLSQTKNIIQFIPKIIKQIGASSVLDIPCGDFNYMKNVDISCNYIGADIVEDIIKDNKNKYPNVDFRHLDIISDELPKCDLVICRDCLVHLSLEDCVNAIDNIKRSGSKFLLATSFLDCKINTQLPSLGWRKLNLEIKPFFLKSIDSFNEGFFKNHNRDKSLILVKI